MKSVRAKLLFTVAAGLPNSGTTTFLRKMLSSSGSTPEPSTGSLLDIYPTAFLKDSVINDGHLLNFQDDDHNDGMLLLALAKIFKMKQFKLDINDENESKEFFFEDEEINEWFIKFCTKFTKFWKELENVPDGDKNPLVALTKSQSFINFLDVNVNKAVYEYLFLVGKRLKNGFLMNVLDLHHYTGEVLNKPLDLTDSHYVGKYKPAECSLFSYHPAVHYFTSTTEATLAEHRHERRALIIGTHIDKFQNKEDQSKAIQEAQKEINSYAEKVDIIEATDPTILPLSNEIDDGGHKRAFKALISLIESQCGHNSYMVLKHMFFYYVLKSTKEMFLTRDIAEQYGVKCEMDGEEITECLQLLHDSCFIYCVNEKYVVLNIPEFIKGFDKLYSSTESNGYDSEFGFVTDVFLKELWGHNSDISPYTLYTKTLKDLGLMVEVTDESTAQYFMPSLRSEHHEFKRLPDSASLIIQYEVYTLPKHYLCFFAKYFMKSDEMKPVRIMENPYCNVLTMKFANKFNVSVSFQKNYIAVTLELFEHTAEEDAYSFIKKKYMDILEHISIPNFQYSFAVICSNQNCSSKFVPFDHDETDHITCNDCKTKIENHSKILWKRVKIIKTPTPQKGKVHSLV